MKMKGRLEKESRIVKENQVQKEDLQKNNEGEMKGSKKKKSEVGGGCKRDNRKGGMQ